MKKRLARLLTDQRGIAPLAWVALFALAALLAGGTYGYLQPEGSGGRAMLGAAQHNITTTIACFQGQCESNPATAPAGGLASGSTQPNLDAQPAGSSAPSGGGAPSATTPQPSWWDRLVQGAGNLVDGAGRLFGAVGDRIADGAQAIGGAASRAWDGVTSWWNSLPTVVKNVLKGVAAGLFIGVALAVIVTLLALAPFTGGLTGVVAVALGIFLSTVAGGLYGLSVGDGEFSLLWCALVCIPAFFAAPLLLNAGAATFTIPFIGTKVTGWLAVGIMAFTGFLVGLGWEILFDLPYLNAHGELPRPWYTYLASGVNGALSFLGMFFLLRWIFTAPGWKDSVPRILSDRMAKSRQAAATFWGDGVKIAKLFAKALQQGVKTIRGSHSR